MPVCCLTPGAVVDIPFVVVISVPGSPFVDEYMPIVISDDAAPATTLAANFVNVFVTGIQIGTEYKRPAAIVMFWYATAIGLV